MSCHQHILNDMFGLHTKAILKTTGLELEDLIYVSFIDQVSLQALLAGSFLGSNDNPMILSKDSFSY